MTNTDLNLQELSTEGKWWFPGNENNKFFGKLEYNHLRGGMLFLSDTFDKLFNFPRHNEDFVLIGEIIDKENSQANKIKVSVLIANVKNVRQNINVEQNTVEVQSDVKYIFLGIHLKDDRLEFNKVSFSYSNLDNWLEPSDLPFSKHEQSIDEGQKRFQGWTVYSSPIIKLKEGFEIEIVASPKTRKEGNKLVRESNVEFIIKAGKITSLDNYRAIEKKIRDFLNFIINKEVLLQHFEATHNLEDNPEPATILFPSSLGENMNKIHVKSPFLFGYGEISEQIDSILNRWFQIYEETPEILDIYFGVMYNTQSYLTNNFLMLFTALEVYHRVFLDKTKRKEVYSKRRIEEIYDQFDDIMPRLSSKIENKSKFVTKIVELRNNLVHGKIRYDKIDNKDLFWEQRNLQLLLQLCILCMLGFAVEKIRQFYLLDKIPIG